MLCFSMLEIIFFSNAANLKFEFGFSFWFSHFEKKKNWWLGFSQFGSNLKIQFNFQSNSIIDHFCSFSFLFFSKDCKIQKMIFVFSNFTLTIQIPIWFKIIYYWWSNNNHLDTTINFQFHFQFLFFQLPLFFFQNFLILLFIFFFFNAQQPMFIFVFLN